MTSSRPIIKGPAIPRQRSFMAQPFKHPTSGVYYLRRRVPDELRSILGREYKRSLKTRDPSEAKGRFAAEYAKSEEVFSLARLQLQGTAVLSARDIQQLASRWFRQELDEMERTGEFRTFLIPGSVESWETPYGWEERQEYLSYREAVESGNEIDAAGASLSYARKAMKAESLPFPQENTAARNNLVEAFHEHLFKLSDIAKQRHEGNWLAEVNVLHHEPLSIGNREKTKAKTLLECFEAYAKAKTLDDGDNRSTRKTLDEFRSSLRRFVELFGDVEVTKLTRAVVQEYRSKLAEFPVKTAGAGKLTAQQLIDKAKAESLPLLSPATIRNRLRALSAVLGFAVRMDWIKENPVEAGGIAKAAAKAAGARADRKRKDYTQAELQAIFSSAAFTQRDWKPAGGGNYGKAWYWLPLLMYYTGCRREELAQLAVADVSEEDGIPYLSILAHEDDGPEDDDRTVKTAGSRRRVPLHPDLLRLGFREYAASVPADGQLFPLLKPSPAGFYGANWGKAWGRYIRDEACISGPASPSHGFRHTFKTLSRQVGIPEDVHDAITGHSPKNVSRDYGSMPLSRIAQELEKFPPAPLLALKA
ncbi:site-specific integrase [Pseudomonas schmalbachii]|uniref:Site-specific integrase n=1 Tax=Pseudomonas schmalbachii TaxID=2816993 RepID=A0ABS3TX58_9PSED|nr:site-specific integrase [Pseudomonas schmalbachii]MBO3278245.1 site-specific integrase [Pseudomonas schmalbachii]